MYLIPTSVGNISEMFLLWKCYQKLQTHVLIQRLTVSNRAWYALLAFSSKKSTSAFWGRKGATGTEKWQLRCTSPASGSGTWPWLTWSTGGWPWTVSGASSFLGASATQVRQLLQKKSHSFFSLSLSQRIGFHFSSWYAKQVQHGRDRSGKSRWSK